MKKNSFIISQVRVRFKYAVWVLLIGLYLIVPLQHLDAYAYDYDEGPNLQSAALTSRGYPIYAEVVINKLPFATWLLQASFTLGGMTLTTARLTFLLTTLIGFVSLGLLSEMLLGKGAGPATMVVFLANSETVTRAAVVMHDIPAISMVLVSMVAATHFRKKTQWRWAFISAIMFAIAIGLHPLLYFMGIPIFWILLAPKRHLPLDIRRALHLIILFGGIGITVLGTVILFVDSPGFIRWVYQYNATASHITEYLPGWVLVIDYLWAHWQLIALAIWAVAPLVLTRCRLGLSTSLIWGFMTLTALALYHPLWEHYLIFLLYTYAMLAGGGIAVTLNIVLRSMGSSQQRTKLQWVYSLLGLVLVGLLSYHRLHTAPVWPSEPVSHTHTADYLSKIVEVGDIISRDTFIVTDNQFFAFANNYLVPPLLADTSFKRIRSGFLHIGDVVSAVHNYNTPAIVLDFDEGRFYHFNDLIKGIEVITKPSQCFDEICVYPVSPYLMSNGVISDSIRLRAYNMTEDTSVKHSGLVTATLYWESLVPVKEDLTIFVHLLDENANLVTQHDGPPLYGTAPVSEWETGMVIPDPHPLNLSDVTAGTYNVAVGMYRKPSLERLSAIDQHGMSWLHDAIIITTLDIKER